VSHNLAALRFCFAVLISAAVFPLSACHSYHVDTTIENRTGADIQLLEVDYPSASFGADRLAAGAVFHYRFQILGSGPVKIQYTAHDGRQVQSTGPNLVERQQGQLQVLLLPDGRCQFLPRLTPLF
jgi:hypothetical protein